MQLSSRLYLNGIQLLYHTLTNSESIVHKNEILIANHILYLLINFTLKEMTSPFDFSFKINKLLVILLYFITLQFPTQMYTVTNPVEKNH